MKINSSLPLSHINNYGNINYRLRPSIINASTENISTVQHNIVPFTGLFPFFKLNKKSNIQPDTIDNRTYSPFAEELAKGIKDTFNKNIHPADLNCVMTPVEIRKLLPTLNEESFNCSDDNVEQGIYCADLDYQTNFSNGRDSVPALLDKVTKYADEYYSKTGKKFVFAITDHDTVEGIQHALKLISEEPEKYKNVQVITGLKLSYAHKAPNSKIGYENSDMLIYGLNPYSKNVNDFIDNTINDRKKMIVDFIYKVYKLYPEYAYRVIEFARQNGLKYKKSYGVSNLYWRVREYTETKGDISIKSLDMDPKDVYKDVMSILFGLNDIELGSDAGFTSSSGTRIINRDDDVNKSIKEVFDFYSTHYDEEKGKVVSSAENTYEDMIACLSKEPENPVLAMASPYYFSHYYEKFNPETFEKVVQFMNELKEKSNGMLVAFESLSPWYDLDNNLEKFTIDRFNDYIRKNTDLYEVGGSFAKIRQ